MIDDPANEAGKPRDLDYAQARLAYSIIQSLLEHTRVVSDLVALMAQTLDEDTVNELTQRLERAHETNTNLMEERLVSPLSLRRGSPGRKTVSTCWLSSVRSSTGSPAPAAAPAKECRIGPS